MINMFYWKSLSNQVFGFGPGCEKITRFKKPSLASWKRMVICEHCHCQNQRWEGKTPDVTELLRTSKLLRYFVHVFFLKKLGGYLSIMFVFSSRVGLFKRSSKRQAGIFWIYFDRIHAEKRLILKEIVAKGI